MAEVFFDFDSSSKEKKQRGGIKSFTFTSSGKNGESHRKNRVKKAQHAVANRAARASLYQERARMSAQQFHTGLENIAKGLV